jgi:hypothetical protein
MYERAMHQRMNMAASLVAPEPISGDGSEERRQGAAAGFPPRPTNANRRQSKRQRVLLGALIVDLETDTIIQCRAENASQSGVRLKLAELRFVPPTVWLIAVTVGLAYKATVMWRRDDRIGVSVEEPVDLSDPTNRTERRLSKIWTERR